MPKAHLIVDGYNVICATDKYEELFDHEINDLYHLAREQLIADVAAYAHGRYDATIVFDGTGNPESKGIPSKRAGMTIIFSRAGLTADTVVEGLTTKWRDAGEEVLVVSSDSSIQSTVRGNHVSRMSAKTFVGETNIDRRDWSRELKRPSRSTVGDRIDPEVRKKLDEMLGRRSD